MSPRAYDDVASPVVPTPVRATTRLVDTSDEALLRAWWEVGQAATAQRPLDSWPVWEVSRVALPMARTDCRLHLLVAEDGGEVVGSAMLVLFRHDNTHLGEVDVWVHPDHRRRGVGSALLEACERICPRRRAHDPDLQRLRAAARRQRGVGLRGPARVRPGER